MKNIEHSFKFNHSEEDWMDGIGATHELMDTVAIKLSMCCNEGINKEFCNSEMTEMICNLYTQEELVVLATVSAMEKIEQIVQENPEMLFMNEVKKKAQALGIEIKDKEHDFESVKERYMKFREGHKEAIEKAKEKARDGKPNGGMIMMKDDKKFGDVVDAFKKANGMIDAELGKPKPYIKKEE